MLQRIIDNKYKAPPLAFGTETCSIFPLASLSARQSGGADSAGRLAAVFVGHYWLGLGEPPCSKA
ncbi:hypothetical protein X737_21440 [Mesorhizobium sp. L48C026A00]|nr:hypothetical protein X737_21440 [Mesorhizobium sp. L48C026A00]